MSTYEQYFDEIIKLAFQAKCEFAKDERERQEFKSKIIVLSNGFRQTKQESAVLPQEEEMRKYKGKTIKKRADGRWWARYYANNEKQKSVYGKTQNECLNRLKEALRQNKGNQTNVTSSITLGEWLKKWLELYKVGKVRSTTIVQMDIYLRDVYSDRIASIPLKKLSPIDLQEFINNVVKPRKREKLYTFLKDALTKAVKAKLIPDNLFDGIDKPKHERKQSRSLTRDEERRFVEECSKYKQGNLYLLCLYQGLRLGEALALTYEDIDFDKMTISINKSLDSLGETTAPKTATSNRVIPLFKRTLALLERGASGKLFTMSRKGYQNTIIKIRHKLEMENVNVHTMRHTFATRCSEAGIPAKVVQKWLGHSTLEMTLNVYTHVNADFEAKMTNQFDTYFDTYAD
ncbi:MAG: site-specific integrase [Firmicutes bacterium]|nr:site-specific integrase [Bacillota bacterium]